jgi:serine/threonine protein kinase
MLPEVAASEQAAARFLNEARAAAKIEGEHVARVFDVGQLETGAPFIALELLDGSDLAKLLEANGPLPAPQAVDYVLQALEALAQAHVLGIVHRDLKPANLFLSQRRDGSQIVKVLDFGISKVLDPETGASPNSLTGSSSVLGSPLYMAPEQVRNSKRVDYRADVWAVGVILFELLSGRPPFDAESVAELFVAILERPPLALRALRPDLPKALEEVVMRCLARDPSGRFDDVRDLATALAPFAPPHARASVDRIARTMARAPKTPSALPGALDATARAGLPEVANASHSPWSSTHRQVRRGRTPWVLGALVGAGVVSVGLARIVGGHHGSLEIFDAQAPAVASFAGQSAVGRPELGPEAGALEAGPSLPTSVATLPSTPAPPPTPARPHVVRTVPSHDPFDTPR